MKRLQGFLLFATGFVSGALALAAAPALAERDLPTRGLQTMVEVMNRIGTDYVDPVPDSRLIEQCIAGMTALDQLSQYYTPTEFKDLTGTNRSRQASVGLELRIVNHQTIVVAPLDGTPAAGADIQPGDVVLAIDSVPVTGRRLSDTVRMLRGDKGTTVTLTMFRPGTTAPVDKVLTREPLGSQALALAERLPGGVVYLRISTFHNRTAEHIRDALKAAAGPEKATGLVVDLRQNGGGVLTSVVEVADLFVESGTLLSIEGRIAESNRTYRATPGATYSGVPIIVLVDAGTASGSEIVADALRTHAGARLIGTKTFGLGTIQTILPLQDDSAIKITTARWKTAGGTIIEGNGLKPDIEMAMPGKRLPLDQDPVVQRALAELKVKFT